MEMKEYAGLIATANRFNEICDAKGIPCRAAVKMIWLDFGADWKDYSIVIRDLTRPADDILSSVQVNFRERELAMKLKIDEAVENMLSYSKCSR